MTWEIMLDGIYLDGERLPESTLSSPRIELSALVDTGNSLLRGPADVVELIYRRIGSRGLFPCTEPHTLAFEIGGKMFPVDPRDFASQAFRNDVQRCAANVVATDAPRIGGYQFGWILGVPFLKSVLSSYYYGNITYPSQDIPKMGFLSTVPADAADKMRIAVAAASSAGRNFPATTHAAPKGTGSAPPFASSTGPQATPSTSQAKKGSSRRADQLEISSAWGAFITLWLVAWSIPNLLPV
jgi:phytepsin